MTTRTQDTGGLNGDERAATTPPIDNHSTEDPHARTGAVRLRLVFWLLCLVLATGFALQLTTVSIDRFGEYYDDTIYVTAAKSLATGEGYSIISLPQPVAQTLVPPFFPMVLSVIWKIFPRFPDNLVLMMLFSSIAMIGFLLMSWRYLVKNGYASPLQALAVVSLTAINWRMMSLATSIISEVLFALLSITALHFAEKYEEERSTWKTGAALGLIAGLVFLTRTSGLVLLVTVVTYYAFRRKFKKVLVPSLVAGLFIVGWFGWCYVNRTAGGGEHGSYYGGYAQGISDTIGRLQTLNADSWVGVYLKIIETNLFGLILVWAPMQSLGLRATLPMALLVPLMLLAFALMVAGFIRETRRGVRLLQIFCVFHLGVHLIVPSHSYERYVMPIVPFLLFFIVRELSGLVSIVKSLMISNSILAKAAGGAIGIFICAAASATIYSNSSGIYLSATDRKQSARSEEDKQTFDWIRANTKPSSVLVCFGDLKCFLYTDRKTVRSIPVNILDLTVYQAKDPDSDDLEKVFLNILDENRGTHVVLTPSDFRDQAPAYGKSVEDYITMHPEQFVQVFQSGAGNTLIYQIRNPETDRVGKT